MQWSSLPQMRILLAERPRLERVKKRWTLLLLLRTWASYLLVVGREKVVGVSTLDAFCIPGRASARVGTARNSCWNIFLILKKRPGSGSYARLISV
jgi:hypothetical protein